MIDFYTWHTPNGFKISILLEELKWDYKLFEVDITKDQQFSSDFIKISPNNKIPALIDWDGPDGAPITIFESGAILIYLANKAGHFISANSRQHMREIQWVMFQMQQIGPIFGQVHHFRKRQETEVSYERMRYLKKTHEIYQLLNKRLLTNEFIAGTEYSIADIAIWPWISRFEWHEIDLHNFPSLKRWFEKIWLRPAVKRGRGIPRVGSSWALAFDEQDLPGC